MVDGAILNTRTYPVDGGVILNIRTHVVNRNRWRLGRESGRQVRPRRASAVLAYHDNYIIDRS